MLNTIGSTNTRKDKNNFSTQPNESIDNQFNLEIIAYLLNS